MEGRRVRELRRTALFWKTRTLLLDKCRKGHNTGLFNFNSSAVKELHYDSNKKLFLLTHCYPFLLLIRRRKKEGKKGRGLILEKKERT